MKYVGFTEIDFLKLRTTLKDDDGVVDDVCNFIVNDKDNDLKVFKYVHDNYSGKYVVYFPNIIATS